MIIARLEGMPEDQIYQIDSVFAFNNFITHSFSIHSANAKNPSRVFLKCPEPLLLDWAEVPDLLVSAGMSPSERLAAYSVITECFKKMEFKADIVNEVRCNQARYELNLQPLVKGEVIEFPFRKRN